MAAINTATNVRMSEGELGTFLMIHPLTVEWEDSLYPDVYLNYSCNCGTSGFDTNEPVYIQCNMTNTGHWRFENITQTFVSGKYYIYLGKTRNDTGGHRIWLSDVHPVYYYDGSALTDAESHRLSAGGGGVLAVDFGNISSLPTTVSDPRITEDMALVRYYISDLRAQIGTWTVTTANGSVTLSGTIRSATSVTLYLEKTI